MPFDPNRRANIIEEGTPEAPRELTQERKTPNVPKIPPNVVPWDGPRQTAEESEAWMQAECLSLAVQKQKEFCELVEFKKRNVLAQVWTDAQEQDYQKVRLATAEFFHKFLTTQESDGLFFTRVVLPLRREGLYSAEWRKKQVENLFEKHPLARTELGAL